MATVARNQPCPCGSGKRYKECHGAIRAAAPAAAPAFALDELQVVEQAMRDALKARSAGRHVDAANLYRSVLAVDPFHFAATLKLAKVEYECGRFAAAQALLRRATELRPEADEPRHDLRSLESMLAIEREICRDVLSRLAARVEAVGDLGALATAATRVHIVIAEAIGEPDHAALARVVHACRAASTNIWGDPGVKTLPEGARPLNVATGDHPAGGLLILFGSAYSPVAWLAPVRPERVVLMVIRDDPCAVIDRIDELGLTGYTRPGLMLATPGLAERLRLPGSRLEAGAPHTARGAS
jgi:hypothetical protein